MIGSLASNSRGSVLLEQLVAIAVLGLLVVSTFSLLTTGTLAAQTAQKMSVAGTLAAQKLEEFSGQCGEFTTTPRQPLDPQQFPGYQWRAVVEEAAPGLCRVTVTVWWPVRGQERQTSLSTLARRQEGP
ncbi:MAG: hypothetical protein QN131_00150 [Armatimonadota bacterium]|nr:hypothetical protein [Armatimonadota bacterium]MDR7548336.1 hypothetical protein [Armatimonadota bacterium]